MPWTRHLPVASMNQHNSRVRLLTPTDPSSRYRDLRHRPPSRESAAHFQATRRLLCDETGTRHSRDTSLICALKRSSTHHLSLRLSIHANKDLPVISPKSICFHVYMQACHSRRRWLPQPKLMLTAPRNASSAIEPIPRSRDPKRPVTSATERAALSMGIINGRHQAGRQAGRHQYVQNPEQHIGRAISSHGLVGLRAASRRVRAMSAEQIACSTSTVLPGGSD
jgi:hypothetical protein